MSNERTVSDRPRETSRDESGGTPRTETSPTDPQTETASSKASVDADACPECGGSVTAADTDERVCADCGLVIEDQRIDSGPEWRAFDAAERDERSRVGAPMTEMLHDKGLSTTIGFDKTDAYGNALGGRKRRQLKRLRTWNRRSKTEDAHDRNLRHALGEIDRMASALGLPQPIRETASVIYRRALNEDLLRGRSIEGMAAASLYAASRLDGVARSIDEIATVSRVGDLEIKRAYRYIDRELGLETPPAHPNEYLGRFASELDCEEATERLARDLAETAVEEAVHSGKSPVGIAASALYAASRLRNEGLTQAAISETANVSEVTIRNRYREVLEVAEISHPE
jgi:transcription initiation factor TFIIB